MNVSGKVHMATRYTNNHQYVYLTYNIICGNGPDGGTHSKVLLDVIDATNIFSPTVVRSWIFGSCTTDNNNAFEPVVLAAENFDRFAWGFYVQANGNPADTRFAILSATDPTIASFTGSQYVDSGFPTLIIDNVAPPGTTDPGYDYGLGDYIGGSDDASGNLFFTYGRPVTTSATTCPAGSGMPSPTTCGTAPNHLYSVGLFAAKVTP